MKCKEIMKDNIFKFISPFEMKIVVTIMMMTMMMVTLMLRQMVNLITRPSGEGGGEGLLVDSVLCYATNPNLALHAAPIINNPAGLTANSKRLRPEHVIVKYWQTIRINAVVSSLYQESAISELKLFSFSKLVPR